MRIQITFLLAIVAVAAQAQFPLKEDVSTLDGIMKAYYEVVSGPEGPKQTERDKSLHHPDAFIAIAGENKDGKPFVNTMSLAEFHKTMSPAAFYEYEISRKTETFGHMTSVWSTYAYKDKPDGKALGRGINNIQLYHDGERWWIMSWMYDSERANNPIPKEYLPAKR